MRRALLGLFCGSPSSVFLYSAVGNVGFGLCLGALLGIGQVLAFFDLDTGSAIDRAMTCAGFSLLSWVSINLIVLPVAAGQVPQLTAGDMRALFAALVGCTSPAIGLLVHFLSSGLVGVSYGLLFERESPDFAAGIAWRLLYGLVLWFAGRLTLFPILQGLSFTWTHEAASAALLVLVGHLIYGAVTALVFLALQRRHRNWLLSDPRFAARLARLRRPPAHRLQQSGSLLRALECYSKSF